MEKGMIAKCQACGRELIDESKELCERCCALFNYHDYGYDKTEKCIRCIKCGNTKHIHLNLLKNKV